MEKNKCLEAFLGAYWLLLTGAYLLWSFLGDAWHISWLVFAVGGVAFAAVETLLEIFWVKKGK